MFNLVSNEKIKTVVYNDMKVLPNNLDKLMQRFNYTDKSLGELLRLEKSFINLVKQQKSNLSGSGTILLMKKLNVSFNLIYDLNEEVTILKESSDEYFSIYEVDSVHIDNEMKKHIALNIQDSLDIKEEDVLYLKYFSLITDNNIDLSDSTTRFINEKLKSKYDEITKQATLDKNKIYVFVGYTVKRYNEELLDINFGKNMDNDATTYLYNKKFSKKSIYKFKEYREYKGYDRQFMANLLGLTLGTYTQVENREQQLSTRVMWRIQTNLGIPVESIINVDGYYSKFVKADYNKKK